MGAVLSKIFGEMWDFTKEGLHFVFHLVAVSYHTDAVQDVAELDRFVMRHCNPSARTFSPTTPGDGVIVRSYWPLVTLRRYRELGPDGTPVVNYTIYALKHVHVSAVRALLAQPPVNTLEVRKISSTASWQIRSMATHVHVHVDTTRDGQAKCVADLLQPLLDEFGLGLDVEDKEQEEKRAAGGEKKTMAMLRSRAMLVSGPSGCGKSQVARLAAAKIRTFCPGTRPIVVEGFSLIMPGLGLFDHVLNLRSDPSVPIVLLIDEYDVAVKHAQLGEAPRGEYRCLAQNKTSLCQFLDDLADTPNVYTVATTNESLDFFRKNEALRPYYREGRFHSWHEIVSESPSRD